MVASKDYIYNKARRSENKARLLALLGGKCIVCGSTERLHFDHIKPSTKLFDISQHLTDANQRLMDEVKKCQLLCGRCHGQKTAKDNGWQSYHGKLSMYTNGKCRCVKCRKANAEYTRSQRKGQQ